MDNLDFETLANSMRKTLGQPNLMIDRQTTTDDVSGWDSLSHVWIMQDLETAFRVPIPADETADLPNVGTLFDFIVQKRAKP